MICYSGTSVPETFHYKLVFHATNVAGGTPTGTLLNWFEKLVRYNWQALAWLEKCAGIYIELSQFDSKLIPFVEPHKCKLLNRVSQSYPPNPKERGIKIFGEPAPVRFFWWCSETFVRYSKKVLLLPPMQSYFQWPWEEKHEQREVRTDEGWNTNILVNLHMRAGDTHTLSHTHTLIRLPQTNKTGMVDLVISLKLSMIALTNNVSPQAWPLPGLRSIACLGK